MSDVTKRVSAWAAKSKPERVKQTLDELHEKMTERYVAAMEQLYPVELKTKETLNKYGVPTVLYVPYLNYARQLYKLTRGRLISGESLAMDADVLLEKWAARTLDRKVLAAIRFEVFTIGEPRK
jgi:hypothetical protein